MSNSVASVRSLIILLAGVTAAAAQDAPRGNWQTPGQIQTPGSIQTPGAIQQPGEIQKPAGTWQTPGQIQKAGEIQKPGEIQQPKGPWITPGEIQQPKGPWITPGEIQVPKGIEAVKVVTNGCENRLSVLADALFDFDKANLRPDAEATLKAALPEIAKAAGKAARVEGHTDGKGTDAYNMKLSEARGRTVRDWLGANGAIPPATPIKGYGKRVPIAPNTTPDGRDDPEGRQKNRRVEIVFETCKI
jgi:outer membrane protein OmpA-like peptidoglycan-associated protein